MSYGNRQGSLVFASLICLGLLAVPTRLMADLPGPTATGDVLLPNGWTLHPAGQSLDLGDLPENLALHPGGRWLAVLHGGYGSQEIDIVDVTTDIIATRAPVASSFYGLAFDASGAHLYASGGADNSVHTYNFDDGKLIEQAPIAQAGTPGAVLVGGLAVDEANHRVYAALTFGDSLSYGPTDGSSKTQALALAAGAFPYALTVDGKNGRLFVSLWGQAAVAVVDLAGPSVVATWKTASHPTEMVLSPDGKRLFVACSNSTNVTVLDTATGDARETINTALYPDAPNGNTPNSLALTPDGVMLLVANADANNLAVLNVATPGAAVPLGFIPVGWYPTAVRYNAATKRIYVANGKGARSLPNPKGPSGTQYIADLLKGTLSAIDMPTPPQLRDYSQQAFALSPLKSGQAVAKAPPAANFPVPAKVGDTSPLTHVIYVIKENRTYDQVFGDVPTGNGDASLCLFPDKVTPNHHKLAKEFVLLDNFYADGEVSANGHEWSMAAYATDFVEKMWPLNYRGTRAVSYPAEGTYDQIARPAGGYLWDRAAQKGLTYLSLGEWVTNGDSPADPATPSVAGLKDHIDPLYRGFDLNVSDQTRADRFGVDLAGWVQSGTMPALVIVRLPNDHTSGARAGKPTVQAQMADNDLALGRIVDAVSHSPFWASTALFIVEDDAQNGPDHVDAHRTVALVVSPYTKRGVVDSDMYSTSGMLRTMELILGLPPMSQFDAAATPMYDSFQTQAVTTPYDHVIPDVDLKALNPATGPGARASAKLLLNKEDANDPAVMNAIIWRAVKGPTAVVPAPVRAAFVVPHAKGDDDDD